MRKSGILLHISSLPSPYGIGTLGKEAYRFVDFLEKAGLVSARTDGKGYIDKFRNRIIVPVYNEKGDVVAFCIGEPQANGKCFVTHFGCNPSVCVQISSA